MYRMDGQLCYFSNFRRHCGQFGSTHLAHDVMATNVLDVLKNRSIDRPLCINLICRLARHLIDACYVSAQRCGTNAVALFPKRERGKTSILCAAPWARATKNVKKPQNQICESCRKLDLRFL